MSSPLPTLNDMLDPDKKQAPKPDANDKTTEEKELKIEENVIHEAQKVESEEVKKDDEEEVKLQEEEPKKEEEPKNEEIKIEEVKEEPKKEEIKIEEVKEEPKKEEAKNEDGPKVEEEPKKEKKEKKAPRKPREPEPEIPTDFTELIKELNEIKKQGNELYKKNSFEEAIAKYKEGQEKLDAIISKVHLERSYNPQSNDLLDLYKQILSNLSLCYIKLGKNSESIDLNLKIISIDEKYDKAYARLFNAYIKIGKKSEACYFGDILLKFDDDTKNKYKDIIEEIEKAKKEIQDEVDKRRAEERKAMMKSIAKYAVPILVLIAAVCIYFFVFKKKKLPK